MSIWATQRLAVAHVVHRHASVHSSQTSLLLNHRLGRMEGSVGLSGDSEQNTVPLSGFHSHCAYMPPTRPDLDHPINPIEGKSRP